MKKSVKVTLIVAAALVGLGLCLTTVGFCMGGQFNDLRSMRLDTATGQWQQADKTKEPTDNYTGADYISDKADITALDIDWISGDVKILQTKDDAIRVEERIWNNSYSAHPMVVTDDNGILRIRYAEDTWLNAIDLPEKELTVYLPRAVAENLTEVRLNSVSADFDVAALTVKNTLTFDSVSGDLETDFITADSAEVNTVSGKIELDGSFRQVTGGSTSGEVDLALRKCPEKLDLVTVSGDVELKLPQNAGFTLNYSTVSGDLESDFLLTTERDGGHICGDGREYCPFPPPAAHYPSKNWDKENAGGNKNFTISG